MFDTSPLTQFLYHDLLMPDDAFPTKIRKLVIACFFSWSCIIYGFTVALESLSRASSHSYLYTGALQIIYAFISWIYIKRTKTAPDWLVSTTVVFTNLSCIIRSLLVPNLPQETRLFALAIYCVVVQIPRLYAHLALNGVGLAICLYNTSLGRLAFPSAEDDSPFKIFGYSLSGCFLLGAALVIVHRQSEAETNSRLKVAVGAKRDDMVDYIFHELRNPAHVLAHHVAAAPLEVQALWPDYAAVVSVVDRVSGTLNDMNSILAYERGEHVEIEAATTDDIFSGCAMTTLAVHASVPARFSTRLSDVRLIIRRVIQNANRYAASSVDVSCTSLSPGILAIDVTDDGPGIPAERQETLYSDFTVNKTSATRTHGGTGLGLAVASRAALSIGDTLALVPWPLGPHGPGTTFRVTVPIGDAAPAAHVRVSEVGNTIPLADLRVLFVDDVVVNRMIGEHMLRLALIRPENIVLACDGQEAVAQHSRQPFHVVFMDLMMPVMNGFEAMRQIRSVDRRVLLVTASASCHPKDMELATECGSDVFLTKPFTLRDVQRVLARFWGPGEEVQNVPPSTPLEPPSTAPDEPHPAADVDLVSNL